MLGIALLLMIGLSIVILMLVTGSPIPGLIPNIGHRRLITGFLFGSTGALIAISPVGKASGAHINPIVTLAFFLMQKINNRTAISYVLGQFAGAIIGCIPILAWGSMGRSVIRRYDARRRLCTDDSTAGRNHNHIYYGNLAGSISHVRNLRPYTPAIFPFLYSIMSFLESAISGTSTNPARSFGPAIISGQWDGWWIYWIGPVTGSLLATLAVSFLAKRITVAKIYHFDTESDRLFRRKESANFEGS